MIAIFRLSGIINHAIKKAREKKTFDCNVLSKCLIHMIFMNSICIPKWFIHTFWTIDTETETAKIINQTRAHARILLSLR